MVTYVTRPEWGSLDTAPALDRDGVVEPYVYVHHMASRWPTSPEDERKLMRETQAYAINVKGYTDMDYNLAVGPSGIIYEGRGTATIPAATFNMNGYSRAVVAMGNTDIRHPTDAQLAGIAAAIQLLQLAGELGPDVKIFGHRDSPYANTACPGRYLYPELPTIRALVAQPPPEDDMAIFMAEQPDPGQYPVVYSVTGNIRRKVRSREHMQQMVNDHTAATMDVRTVPKGHFAYWDYVEHP